MTENSAQAIADWLRDWVSAAAPGAQLPSTRSLVDQHAASPVTVQKAVRSLVSAGLVESRPGVGTFVRAPRAVRTADLSWQTGALGPRPAALPGVPTAMRRGTPDAIGLHAGYPDRALLPDRLVRAALGRVARDPGVLDRVDPQGLEGLRDWFAHELSDAAPSGLAHPSARDVLVVPGSQSGLGSVFRALVSAGEPMLVESPTYWGAIRAAARSGVRLVPVPSGPEGPDPAAVARALDTTGARVFYAQPSFANPTGAQWSAAVSQGVLDVVRSRGAFLVEDDWAHDFAIDSVVQPLVVHDDEGHVVYVRSLTKSVAPSLRVAAVVARGPARDRIRADQGADSMYVSGTLQAAALDVVSRPAWSTHLRGLREQLRSRRDLMATAVAEHLPQSHLALLPRGGLNLWVQLPHDTDLARLVRDCESDGVLVASGDEWFPAEASGAFVRLNYAGRDPERFAAGTAVIGRALEAQLRRPDR